MEPNRTGSGRGRAAVVAALGVILMAGSVTGCGVLGDETGGAEIAVSDAGSTDSTVMDAEEGLASRSRFEQLRRAGTAASSGTTAEAAMSYDCGPGGGEPYVPTAEEIASANADTDALAATFDTYGITYDRITDPVGFAYLQWDNFDVVAQSVNDSFWSDRYPIEPPAQEDLDRMRAENDVVARYLDEAGISYTRDTDSVGWEYLQYDYEEPAAQEAVADAYAELYPPVPPSAEEIAAIKADNDELAAAFDDAGVPYTRISDELGWEWLEWDYEDPDTQARVDAVFNELYPPVEMPCLIAEAAGESVASAGSVGGGAEAVEVAPAVEPEVIVVAPGEGGDTEVADELTIDPGSDPFAEPTPEQVARRDAEAGALVAGFEAAGVTHELVGESPWQTVVFDIADTASVAVVSDVLAARN